MARLLKNPDLSPGSLAARLPISTSAQGDSPVTGLIRFNQTNSKIEFFYNGVWNQVAKIGSVQLVVDDLVGNGTLFDFTMSQPETDATAIVVTIGGVYQIPGTNYTVNGTTISFTSPPPAASLPNSPNRINIIHNLNSTNAA
jgi:hypothetical protein